MQIDITDMNEEELEMELHKVEVDKDDFARDTQEFTNMMKYAEDESTKRYYMMNDVRDLCSNEDIHTITNLEENQSLLENELRRGRGVSENIKEQEKKQQEYWNFYEEDIRYEIKAKQDKQKENEQSQRGY